MSKAPSYLTKMSCYTNKEFNSLCKVVTNENANGFYMEPIAYSNWHVKGRTHLDGRPIIGHCKKENIKKMERVRGFEVVTAYKDKDIKIPVRKTEKSAAYDIEAAEDIMLYPDTIKLIPTGLKAYMQDDEYLALHIRSSIAVKKQLTMVNCTGIIDSDYYNNEDNEGHFFIAVKNENEDIQYIKKGERIAQAIFAKYLVIDDDNATGKRKGGFGSTGTN